MMRIITVAKMLWSHEAQPSESTTNFDHRDDNQIARSVEIVVKIYFDICCIRLMDQSFGAPLSLVVYNINCFGLAIRFPNQIFSSKIKYD